MSENLLYNRDRNISGVTTPQLLSALSLTPSYGSQVEFKADNTEYVTDNFYTNRLPLSLNSLSASFTVRYKVNEENAQKLANFFESKSGHQALEFNPDNSGIYKNISGFCNAYGINFANNQRFEVAAQIDCDTGPTLLNWSGGCYVNTGVRKWALGNTYQKYDITYTGINHINKLNNFYYATADHTTSSPEVDGPTGTAPKWPQDFFFDPDIGLAPQVEIQVAELNYKHSFAQRLKTSDNAATMGLTYTFSDISERQAKAMLHFLENKGGYRRFKVGITGVTGILPVYNRPKVCYSPQWNHTWNFFDSNQLQVTLIEDPMGVIPTGT